MNNRIVLIYAGRRVSNSKKIVHAYYKESDLLAGSSNPASINFKKKVVNHAIGIKFSCLETDSGIATVEKDGKHGYHLEGFYSVNSEKSEWYVKDRAAYDYIQALKPLKHDFNNSYKSAVANLSSIYDSLPVQQKLAFEIRLIKDIQKYR